MWFVTIIRPPGYLHSHAFDELAETVTFGLIRLGQNAQYHDNFVAAGDHFTIIFGAHLLPPDQLDRLPSSAILYNLEQVNRDSPWLSAPLQHTMRRLTTWDYSLRNIEALARFGIHSQWVPIGTVPEMTRIGSKDFQDIDVLFYGSLNERRSAVIERLKSLGLETVAVFGVYGAERDRLIARSKIVLNLHFYPTNIFEIVRVSYLLANYKAVVTECQADTEIETDVARGLALASYEQLAETCAALVRDDRRRSALEQAGWQCMQARDITAYLKKAISSLIQASTSAAPPEIAP